MKEHPEQLLGFTSSTDSVDALVILPSPTPARRVVQGLEQSQPRVFLITAVCQKEHAYSPQNYSLSRNFLLLTPGNAHEIRNLIRNNAGFCSAVPLQLPYWPTIPIPVSAAARVRSRTISHQVGFSNWRPPSQSARTAGAALHSRLDKSDCRCAGSSVFITQALKP